MTTNNARLMKKNVYGYTPEEEVIHFYRQNPIDACEDLLDIELLWYQQIQLLEFWLKPYCCEKASRGVAKTFGLGVYLCLKGMLYPNIKMIVLAPSLRQTEIVFNKIQHEILPKSAFLRHSIVGGKVKGLGSQNGFSIEFHNGSSIKGYPVGDDGKTIRGLRANIVAIDEYAQMKSEIIEKVISPFLAVQMEGENNQKIFVSTPLYQTNHFYDTYMEYLKLSKEYPHIYSCTSWNFIDVQIDNKPYKIDMNTLYEEFRKIKDRDSFMMEWAGFFPKDTSAFFSSDLISDCEPRTDPIEIELRGDPNSEYAMGIDPARSDDGDNFAITLIKILGENLRHVVHVTASKGKTFPELNDIIRNYIHVKGFNVVKICMDAGPGGGGKALADLLAQGWFHAGMNYKPIVEATGELKKSTNVIPILNMVNFNIPIIDHMYTSMKADMEHKRILFPLTLRIDDNPSKKQAGLEFAWLKSEMINLIPKPTTQGLTFIAGAKIGNEKRPVKDRITSCVLANLAANMQYRDELGIEKHEELPAPLAFWL